MEHSQITKFNRLQEQMEVLSQEVKESTGNPSCGYVLGVLTAKVSPGSFKGGEMRLEVEGLVQCMASVAERILMVQQILKDIPLAHWPLVMETVYNTQKERMEYELANEENGVSPPLEGVEKEITMDEPTNNSGVIGKIRKMMGE